jgi:hypothetical protein
MIGSSTSRLPRSWKVAGRLFRTERTLSRQGLDGLELATWSASKIGAEQVYSDRKSPNFSSHCFGGWVWRRCSEPSWFRAGVWFE